MMETLVPEILLTMPKCAPNDGWRVGSTGTKVKTGNKLLAGLAGTARPIASISASSPETTIAST